MKKEFGKTKIFWPSQQDAAVLSPEEMAAAQADVKELQAKLRAEEEAVAALRKGA